MAAKKKAAKRRTSAWSKTLAPLKKNIDKRIAVQKEFNKLSRADKWKVTNDALGGDYSIRPTTAGPDKMRAAIDKLNKSKKKAAKKKSSKKK